MQCLPRSTRLSDHLKPVVCTVYLNDIPLCHENCATVARPSLPRAAIHPALGKGVVWFTRLILGVVPNLPRQHFQGSQPTSTCQLGQEGFTGQA